MRKYYAVKRASDVPQFDTTGGDIVDEVRKKVVESPYEIECPTCKNRFMAKAGLNICPHCKDEVELQLNINF